MSDEETGEPIVAPVNMEVYMLQTYRIETTIAEKGILTVQGLPFHKGDKVEVIILSSMRQPVNSTRYSLRGKLIRYDASFESVSEADWEVLR
jgi:hypothetical protein